MSGRPFTIIGAVVAIIALGIFLYLGSQKAGPLAAAGPANTRAMVVAARDISVRVPLTTADIKVVQVDAASIPPQSFTKVELLKGLIPIVPIYSGQAVTGNELVASADQVTGAQAAFLPIPKGWVAMTIPTAEQQGVAGFIQAGDYITISAIVNAGGKFANIRTIYTQVHVLRIGQAADSIALQPITARGAATPPPGKAPTAASITVVVTQCQAEFLDWFIANASIKYTLESYHDYTPKDVAVDAACPSVDSTHGVTVGDVGRVWPGLV
jgi:Flp pilus assembly protein CpaB